MTSEKKIEILENRNTKLEEEINALESENEKLRELLDINNVKSVIALQNELRETIQTAKEQAEKYAQLNQEMRRMVKEYESEMNKFMKNKK